MSQTLTPKAEIVDRQPLGRSAVERVNRVLLEMRDMPAFRLVVRENVMVERGNVD